MTPTAVIEIHPELVAYQRQQRARAQWFAVALWNDTVRWNAAVAHNVATARAVSTPAVLGGCGIRSCSRAVAAPSQVQIGTAAASSLMPCGGALYPPCYVAARESGGSYTAFNPSGCGGSGCYGKWQFSGAWAGKLGLPYNLALATPAQQDHAAALLWNGGAGCSNWAAC